jgi:hypothetical protein
MPKAQVESKIYPTEAQVATLPHYVEPGVVSGKTENQVHIGRRGKYSYAYVKGRHGYMYFC